MAYDSIERGLSKIGVTQNIRSRLNNHWEILAEPIQTIMRSYAVPNSYERLKALTRGKKISESEIQEFISKLEIPDEAKANIITTDASQLFRVRS